MGIAQRAKSEDVDRSRQRYDESREQIPENQDETPHRIISVELNFER
jgi:hypothetical protein